MREYRGADNLRSLWQLVSTLTLFVATWGLAWFCLDYSYWLTLLLSIPTAGLLVRLFILAHDCGHGSFFDSKRANHLVGGVLGILTFTPFQHWRKQHSIHHATSGDLDRRGHGDIHMLTVQEYKQLSPWQQFFYRVHRHPIMMFGLGPILYFVVWQRFTMIPKEWKRERRSIHLTNLGIALAISAMCWLVGVVPFILVHLPVIALASSIGAWLFYVQHHYEGTYWQRRENWEYVDAGMDGCSYYELPKLLQWVTASIGLHHIHHLDIQIPNYRLQKCYDENRQLQQVKRLTIRESLSCASLRLWDEATEQMVDFSEIH